MSHYENKKYLQETLRQKNTGINPDRDESSIILAQFMENIEHIKKTAHRFDINKSLYPMDPTSQRMPWIIRAARTLESRGVFRRQDLERQNDVPSYLYDKVHELRTNEEKENQRKAGSKPANTQVIGAKRRRTNRCNEIDTDDGHPDPQSPKNKTNRRNEMGDKPRSSTEHDVDDLSSSLSDIEQKMTKLRKEGQLIDKGSSSGANDKALQKESLIDDPEEDFGDESDEEPKTKKAILSPPKSPLVMIRPNITPKIADASGSKTVDLKTNAEVNKTRDTRITIAFRKIKQKNEVVDKQLKDLVIQLQSIQLKNQQHIRVNEEAQKGLQKELRDLKTTVHNQNKSTHNRLQEGNGKWQELQRRIGALEDDNALDLDF